MTSPETACENSPHTASYPPSHLGVQWNQLQARDLAGVAQLVKDCEDADRALVRCEAHELVDLVEFCTGARCGDAIVGRDHAGTVRAVAWVDITIGADRTACARVNAFVDPASRGRGIGRAVLKWQDRRARQLLAKVAGGKRHGSSRVYNLVDAHVNERRRLYMAAGFSPQRTFEVLNCQLPTPAPLTVDPLKEAADNGIRVQAWDPRRLAEVEALNYRVFDRNWGQQADTYQWWSRALQTCDERWSFIALDEDDAVVGYILTSRRPAQWIATGQAEASGELLGVDPKARGRGIARALLASAMGAAQKCGAKSFTLAVDDNNAQRAHEFYRRMGFAAIGEQVYYALDVN